MKAFVPLILSAILLGSLPACTEQASTDAQAQAEEGALMDGSIGKSELKVKPKWKQVLKVRNKKNHKTQEFKITGSEWKISWKTTPGKGKSDEEFIIILYDKNNEDVSEIIANVAGKDQDFTYLEGKGDYFLSINTNQPYEVTVEEQK